MVIAYNGGVVGATFPSAPITVADWVTFDGCSSTPDTTSPPLDLDSTLPGDETTVTKYGTGCKPGGHAELWTINGGSHIPNLSMAFTPDLVQFLLRSRPALTERSARPVAMGTLEPELLGVARRRRGLQ